MGETIQVTKTKEDFGWSEGEEKMMLRYNPHIPKGKFVVRKRRNTFYWYYQLSVKRLGDNTRTKYLCSTFEGRNEEGKSSFEVCIEKLNSKVREDFVKKVVTTTKLTTLMDEFIKEIMIEEMEKKNRKQETTTSIKNGVRQFKEWVFLKDTRLSDIQKPKFLKDLVKDYLEHLGKKPSPTGKIGLSHNTKRTYLKQVRYFFEWLEDEDVGKGELTLNPITRDFCKKILPPSHQERTGQSERNFYYESRWYDEMYNVLIKKVRDLWINFIQNGHSRKFRNQPLGVGSDIVYFVSLLQLDSGFRLGELLTSYRSREYFLNSNDRMNNSSYTYWEKKEGEWCLFMYWKGKESVIPITTKIRSWIKPEFDGVEVNDYGSPNPTFWDTSLVDVCRLMFRESPFVFSSPMRKKNKLGHYSKTQYSTNLKNMISCQGENSLGWEGYGIFTSHDFRDYFITHKLYSGMSVEEVSRITRNSIQTIQRYYLRMDVRGQLKIQKKMDDTRKVVSEREMEERRKTYDDR